MDEGRILNRIARRTSGGWEYEPDLRHAEMIISEMGLQGANPVSTPGEEENKHAHDHLDVPDDHERHGFMKLILGPHPHDHPNHPEHHERHGLLKVLLGPTAEQAEEERS